MPAWPIAAIVLPLLLPAAEPPTRTFRHDGTDWMGDDAPLFAEAIELAGLAPDGFRFDPEVVALWGGDRWRLPLFDLFFRDPWKASPYAREHATNAREVAGSLHDLQYLAQSDTGIRVRDNYYGSFLTEIRERVEGDGDAALPRALERVGAREIPELETIPPEVGAAAAIILHATVDAAEYRRIGLVEPLASAQCIA